MRRASAVDIEELLKGPLWWQRLWQRLKRKDEGEAPLDRRGRWPAARRLIDLRPDRRR